MTYEAAETTPPPLARIYGEPLAEIPADLFIPPDALRIILEAFEGPLDLLLYLIRKHNLDVLDIPMAQLTAQYMAYVEMMRTQQLELAAEYLLMAALLIEIKSRMLLPKPPAARQEEDDPRAELVRRLLEYEQMKKAARAVDELPLVGRNVALVSVWVERVVVERLPDVDPEDLRTAWLGLVARAKATRHHRVTREQLSVRERMSSVLRRLKGRGFMQFEALFDPTRGISDLVVTLLAILELARESLIQITQQASHTPIYLRLTHGTDA
jgi:segregation and condensation protein A